MSWRVAQSLDQLLVELNKLAPARSKISDGAIGDAAHASRDSDHNPWVKDGLTGVVTARDFTHDPAHGADMHKIVAQLVKKRDSRIKYIIWHKQIWRSYDKKGLPAWTAAAYTGTNGHTKHAHISVKSDKSSYDSVMPWGLSKSGGAPTPIKPNPQTPSVPQKPSIPKKPSKPNRGPQPQFEKYREGIQLASRVLKEGNAGSDVKWIQAKVGVRADGYFGAITEDAVIEWQQAHKLAADGIVGPITWKALREPPAQPRPPKVVPGNKPQGNSPLPAFAGGDRAGTVKAIQAECIRQGVTMLEQIAYVLATVQHETGNTFQPVREAYYLGDKAEAYRKKSLRYYPYYGRGYVQLTWKENYEKYSKLLGLELVKNPDLVMRPDVSLYVLVHGMKTGTFTSRKLSDYINGSKVNFRGARAIINGTDKADEIAELARKWLSSMKLKKVA
jgi:peptidoglycan hydrolase-like protein with peptidoglycan-binding domain